MSGLAGILRRDGGPIAVGLLELLTDAVAHRGPDGRGCWSDGPVGLGHRQAWTTPQALGDKQPLLDETGLVCATVDGRLDERDELRLSLERAGVRPRADTDGELILQAYLAWGESCPARLIGDFALAIWDGRRGRLFCARDPLGIRPFYYRVDGAATYWGSELRQLLQTPGASLAPNEGILAEYLCGRLVDRQETLYRGVRRLPPGHTLRIDRQGLACRRYYDVDLRRQIRYRSDRDYAEHFSGLLRETVRARLRSVAPVAVFLSGGLDSSSLVAVAADLVRAGEVPADRIDVCTLEFSHPAADERRWVDDVARTAGVQVRRLDADTCVPPPLAAQVAALRDFPDQPNMHPWGLLYEDARRRGLRAALWGYGGDEWLTGDTAHCADLLRRGRLLRLVRQARADLITQARLGGPPVSVTEAIRAAVAPLLPSRVKRRLRGLRGGPVPAWIAPGFARRVDLAMRLSADADEPSAASCAQRAIARQLQSGWSVAEYEMVDRFEARFSMESRYPLNDRRLVEFALALPEEQRWRGTETKVVLRRAMGDRLPASVSRRTGKGDFTYLYPATFEREQAGAVFGDLRLAADGFVRGDEVWRMYRRLAAGSGEDPGTLWMILATEHWYRAVSSGAARAHREAT